MKTKLYLIGSILMLFAFIGCGDIKHKEEFVNKKEEEQYEIINVILKDAGINNIDKSCLAFIDYTLTKSKRCSTLEKIYPGDNFNDFLDKAVPTLYYAYSQDNFEKANNDWKASTKEFLIKSLPYKFSVGEYTFRKYFEYKISEKKDNSIVFGYSNESNQSFEEAEQNSELAYVFVWNNTLTWNDFLKLRPDEQSEIIYYVSLLHLKMYGGSREDVEKISKFSLLWKERSSYLLNLPEIKRINDNLIFGVVVSKGFRS